MTPSICITGASVQQPRQATFSIVNRSVRRRCRRRGRFQMPLQGVLHQLEPLDVAGRAVANADDVLAGRLVAELRVERGHAGDRGRR